MLQSNETNQGSQLPSISWCIVAAWPNCLQQKEQIQPPKANFRETEIILLVILTDSSGQRLFLLVEMLQEKKRALLDERFSTYLACWGSKCTASTMQTLLLSSVIHGHPYLHNNKSCGHVVNKRTKTILTKSFTCFWHLNLRKLWYWSSNADNTKCNVILQMFKPDWSSLVKTSMLFSACLIKQYFTFLAFNSVGYLWVASGFRLLISSLQKWLKFDLTLEWYWDIFAACSQTSHKPVFIRALTTCTTLFAHPSHKDLQLASYGAGFS